MTVAPLMSPELQTRMPDEEGRYNTGVKRRTVRRDSYLLMKRRHNTGVKRRATPPLFYGKEAPTTERSNAACGASA
jgi:hypothetical protein